MRDRTGKELLLTGLVLVVIGSLACTASTPQPAQQDEAPAGPTPKYGGIFAGSMTNDPPSFDLHQESTIDTTKGAVPATDRLLQLDDQDDTKVIPDLAERWEWSSDGKALTFFLRKGVKFHNGNPFTAQDVKFSLDRLRNPPKGVASPRSSFFEPVTDVIVVDDYTVKLNLKRPYPAILTLVALGYMAIYDREFIEQKGQDVVKKEIMGTGPFKFKEYIRGVSIELVKNEDYWVKGRPYLDGIKWYIIPDTGTALAATRSGQLLVGGGSADQVKAIVQAGEGKIRVSDPTPAFVPNTLSINVSRPPFNDIKVRQAISYAFNRTEAANLFDTELGGVLGAPWHLPQEELAKFPGYGNDPTGDIAKARQLLAEAGFPNGFAMTITLRKGVASWLDMAIFAKDRLAKVGITAGISTLESGPFYDVATARDFDMVTSSAGGLSSGDPDAIYGFEWACASPRNFAGYCDQEMEALFLKQSSTLDADARLKLVHELERKALQSQSKFLLGFARSRQLIWTVLQGYYPPRSSATKMLNVWLDK